jgi:hypothetical protein
VALAGTTSDTLKTSSGPVLLTSIWYVTVLPGPAVSLSTLFTRALGSLLVEKNAAMGMCCIGGASVPCAVSGFSCTSPKLNAPFVACVTSAVIDSDCVSSASSEKEVGLTSTLMPLWPEAVT